MKKNQFIFIATIVFVLANILFISAYSEETFTQTKNIIDSKISCKNLTDEQLEILGEYYMEQMHPGGAHELMHKMMGFEEGSEIEEQFHINMAKNLYCGESSSMYSGMMNMMMGGGMMGYGGMMSGSYGSGMAYGNYYKTNYFSIILNILFIVAIILLIIWLGKQIFRK